MKGSLRILVVLILASLPGIAAGEAAPAKEAEPEEEAAVAEAAPAKTELKDQNAKAGYCIGVNIGRSIKNQGLDMDAEALLMGLKDALAGGKLLLTEKQMTEVMTAFQKQMATKRTERGQGMTDKNKKEGEAFLAANGKKEGVKTLPSGLQYKVIKAGDGPSPKETDKVVVHYTGTLIDGSKFDSSIDRGQPATFGVTDVIKGWTEALQLMKVGDKWQVFIPGNLAYGERHGPGGPFATLIFEMELLGIK